MANLKAWQAKLTAGRLYKVRPAANRNVEKTSIISQGGDADTFTVYVAIDGATPNTDPGSLATMSKVLVDVTGSKVFNALDFNFLAVTQAAAGDIYLCGYVVEDLGAIS